MSPLRTQGPIRPVVSFYSMRRTQTAFSNVRGYGSLRLTRNCAPGRDESRCDISVRRQMPKQMPKECPYGKLPTHQIGEKASRHESGATRKHRSSGIAGAPKFLKKRPSCRKNCSHRSCSPARCRCLPCLAQTEPTPQATTARPQSANALTPDQAKRALDTLQDDAKRAQMIETLRAIANASPARPEPAAAPRAQSAHPPIPLAADSLGAQLLLTVSEQFGDVSREVAGLARTLTHFPAFYYWIMRTANDPSAYDQLLDIAWKLALVFGCAFAAEWLAFHLIKRPVAFLEARLPQTAQAPAQAWRKALRPPTRPPPRPTSPPSLSGIGGVSAWRAPGSRWSGCHSCWGASCSNCCRSWCSSVSPPCCSAPGSAISPPRGW